MVAQISAVEFQSRRTAGALLLDVRNDWEIALAPLPDAVHIPMEQIPDRLGELDPGRETVVVCRSGGRSLRVAQFLEQQGFKAVANLTGGVLAWSREVDPSV